MPWRSWHPTEGVDPLEEASAGRLDESVRQAMEMAQKINTGGIFPSSSARGIPRHGRSQAK